MLGRNMNKNYIFLAIIIIVTLLSTWSTYPKVELIEGYRDKAISPVDKTMVEMDTLFNEIGSTMSSDNKVIKSIKHKPVVLTVIQLCIFDNTVFSDIFESVFITSVLYIILIGQIIRIIRKEIKNDAETSTLVILCAILIPSSLIGIYFVGVFIILLVAAISLVISKN